MSVYKKENIYIIGYSGHAYVIIEALNSKKYIVKGYFDLQEVAQNPYNIAYCGNEKADNFKDIVQNAYVFPSIGSNMIRERLINQFSTNGIGQFNIIAQSAIVSKTVVLGTSIFIAEGAIINAQSQIGSGTIVNTGAIIEHECKIGFCAHIAPSAVLTGGVSVGNRSFIGANTVIKQGVKIGDDVIIGAGSVIIQDVADGKRIVGNPGKEI